MGALLDEYRQELSVRQTEPGFDKDAFKTEFLQKRGKSPKQTEKVTGMGLPSRGVVSDIVSAGGRGITGSAEMYLRTLRQFDPEGGKDVIRDIATKGLGALDAFVEKHPFLQPSKEAHSGLRRALTEGTTSFIESASAFIPGLVLSAPSGLAAPFIAAGTGAAIFGLSEKDRFEQEVENFITQNKLTDKEAADLREKGKSGAVKSALVEGGFELAANTLQVVTLGLFRPFKGAAKQAVKTTFKSLFEAPPGSMLKRGTVAYLKTAATEVGTETAQEALETKFRRDIGITDMSSLDAAISVISPTLVTSLLFLGSAKGINTLDKRNIKKGLEEAVNPDGSPASAKKRKKAVDSVVGVIFGKKNKEAAKRLKDSAYAYIDSGLSIDLDTEFGIVEVAGQFAKDLNTGGLDVQEVEKLADGIANERPALSNELKKIASHYRIANGVADIGETTQEGEAQDLADTMINGGDVDLESVEAGVDDVKDVQTPKETEKAVDEELAKPQDTGFPAEKEITAFEPEVVEPEVEKEKVVRPFVPEKIEREAVKEKEVKPFEPEVVTERKAVAEAEEPTEAEAIPGEKPVITPEEPAAEAKVKVDEAAKLTDPSPTEAQIEAGNAKKGHVNVQGLDISIETAEGQERSGTDLTGKPWKVTMKSHYGYIKGTKGRDKEHLDAFIGKDPTSENVFVVNQINPSTGSFDEHKVMLGFDTEENARAGYLENYAKDWKGLKSIVPMSMAEFKEWTKGDTTKELTAPTVTPPVTVKPPVTKITEVQKEVDITSDEDLDALLEATKPETKKKRPVSVTEKKEGRKAKATTKELKEKTAGDILADATKSGVKGVESTMKGLFELFGGASLKSFPGGLDKETYAKAKPHFQQAFTEFGNAGKNLKDFIQFAVNNFGEGIKPYLKFFVQEQRTVVEAPKEKPVKEKPKKPVDVGEKPKPKVKKEKKKPLEVKKVRFKDVGERVPGKRSQKNNFERIKDEIKEAETGNTNKDLNKLLNRAVKSKLWEIKKEDRPNATPGTLRYLEMVRNSAMGVTLYTAEKIGVAFRSGTSKAKLEDYAGIEEAPGDRKGYNEIAEHVARYESSVQMLNAATATASTVQEAHDNIIEMLKDDKWTKGDNIMFSLNPQGKEITDIYSWNDAHKAFSRSVSGFIKDEQLEKATPKQLKRIKIALSEIERAKLPNHRQDNPNPTAQDFIDKFGFRAAEFGEYVDSVSGRRHVNHAWDAFHDLTDLLGIPIKASSVQLPESGFLHGTGESIKGGRQDKGMTLAMAFGARGRGRHSAHYEPMNHLINMTKNNGDGSLSHEWMHSLDSALSITGKGRQAINDLTRALSIKYNIERAKAEVEEILTGNSRWTRERIGRTPIQVAKDFLESKWRAYVRTETNFSKKSDLLGEYWGRNEEKLARGFEAFVYDTLEGSSPYLVSEWVDGGTTSEGNGYRSNPYPAGEEREQFNRMYKHFTDGIEWSKDGVPTMKEDYELVSIREEKLAQEALDKIKEKLEEMFAAMHQGKASKDGLWWYEYRVTKRGALMQPKGINAHDDSFGVSGAVGYTEALLPDDILYYKLKSVTHDKDANKTYLKEKEDVTELEPGDRLDTAGLEGEASLGEVEAEDGEGVETGAGVPRRPVKRTGEESNSPSEFGESGGTSAFGDGASAADVDTATAGVGGNELVSGQDAVLGGGNYRITESDRVGQGTVNEKFSQNISAIRTLKEIEKAGRHATRAEQAILVKYVGWGGMPAAFDQYGNEGWRDKFEILKQTLNEEEFEAARKSTLSAFYTSPEIVTKMYDALQRFGFKGGRILEPATGTGNFFGLLPEVLESSQLSGVEMDSLSARMARQLYQRSSVFQSPYEKSVLPRNFYDVALSNVPFEDVIPFDRDFNKKRFKLHDYYFNKSLELVRPGGIVAFITSAGTMDKVSVEARKELAKKADFIGAIRLPDTAFKDAGTKVTADVIFLRRKGGTGAEIKPQKWLDVKSYEQKQPGKTETFQINEYFASNPDMMLGQLAPTGRWEGGQNLMSDGRDIGEALAGAVEKLPSDIYAELENVVEIDVADLIPDEGVYSDGEFFERDGKVFTFVTGEAAIEYETNTPHQKRKARVIKDYVKIRAARRAMLKAQAKEEAETVQKPLTAKLNKIYDAFVKKYGFLNQPENLRAFITDPEAPRILALENWNDETGEATKSDIFSKKFIENLRPVTSVSKPQDAIPHSLNALGRIDIPYIANLSGVTEDEAIKELEGEIWNDPETGWVVSDEYLSGNIKEKIALAEQASKTDPIYKKNIEALTPLIPEDLPPSQIRANLGAPWIEPKDVQTFIRDLVPQGGNIHVDYVPEIGLWRLTSKGGGSDAEAKRRYKFAKESVAATATWGTSRKNFFDLLEKYILNGSAQGLSIFDKVPGTDKKILNVKETEAAQAKLEAIKEKFSKWLWEDDERLNKYVRKYNDVYNATRERKFNGDHLTFPGKVPDDIIKLTKHQKDAVWRSISTGFNTYFAHEVGTGKTFAMAATIMEAKRLGLKKKPLLLGVKANVDALAEDFARLYPTARILRMDVSGNALKRKIQLNRIANNEWDAVIITHDSFKNIQLSAEGQAEAMEEEIGNLRLSLALAQEAGAANFTVKAIEKRISALNSDLEKRVAELGESKIDLDFEELGVDMVIVDEAHIFKNIPYATKLDGIVGVSGDGSGKAFDLHMKTRWINEKYGGGIILASGTPITNSVSEIYNIGRYLNPQTLRDKGIHTFDAWAAAFGNITQTAEFAPEGGGYRMVRKFKEFFNIPELRAIVREVVDVISAKDLKLKIPGILNGKPIPVVIPQNPMVEALGQEMLMRAKAIRGGGVNEQPRHPDKTDIMFSVISDGRNGAIDMRLVDPTLPDHPDTKANHAVKFIVQQYKASMNMKGTQLVFADRGVPGKGKHRKPFDVYNDIKRKLIKMGVPEKHIAFPRDVKGNKLKKKKLFNQVNAGDVRILIGSTADMGIGVNVQERGVSVHNLDTEWTFEKLEQRRGRFVRQGNILYDKGLPVSIFNYMTEGTVDAFMWDKVANKKITTEVVLTGNTGQREVEDVSQDSASAQEMMAFASGDPRFLHKIELEADVRKLNAVRGNWVDEQYRLKRELGGIPGVILSMQTGIKHREQGKEFFEEINAVKIGDVMYDLKRHSKELGERMAQVLSPKNVKKVHKSENKIPIATLGSAITEEIETEEEVTTEKTVEGKKVSVKEKKVKKNKVLRWKGNDVSVYVRSPMVLGEQKREGLEALKIGTKTRYGEWEMTASGGIARLLANTKIAIDNEIKSNQEIIDKKEKERDDINVEIAKPFDQEEVHTAKTAELQALTQELSVILQEQQEQQALVNPDLERFKSSTAVDITGVDDAKLNQEDKQREDDLKLSVDEKNSIVSQEKQWWDKNEQIGQAIVDNDLVKKASLEADLETINKRLSISKKVKRGEITGTTRVSGIVGEVYDDLFKQAEDILGMGKVSMELVPRAEIAALPGIEKIAKEKGVDIALYREKANIKGAYQGITVNGVAVRGIIKLASDGITSLEGMEQTVRHEIFHGVFRRLLNNKDKKIILDKFKNEEKAADAFADYIAQKGKLLPVSIKGIFGRLQEFFQRLNNLLQGYGFKSAGDIFASAAGGELIDSARYARDDIAFQIEEGVPEEDIISDHDRARKRLDELIKGATAISNQRNQGLTNVVTQNPANVMLNKDHSSLVKEIYSGTKNTDIKWHERMFGLPWFLAKKFKEWDGALGIELKREEDRSLMITEFNKKQGRLEKGEKDQHEIMALKKSEEESVLLSIYEGDARSEVFTDDTLRKGLRLDTLGVLDNKHAGKVIKLSEPQIAAYKAWQTSTGKMKERILEAIDNLTYMPYAHEPWVEKLKATVKTHEMHRARQREVEIEQGKITDYSELRESEIPDRMKPEDRQKFVDAFNKILPKQVKIATLRRTMGEVVGYAPRHRAGKYVVSTYDIDGNTLWSERSEKEKDTKGFIDAQIKRQQALGFKYGKDFTVRKEVRDKASEFIFDQISASSVERFINKALNQAKTKEKISEADINAVTEEMIILLTDEFKGRGFASSMMARKRGFPIGGYDISNIKRRYAEYVSGGSGYITKQVAAYEYANLLSSIDINAKPDLYEDLAKYSGDMLRNTTRLDRVSGRVRTAAFVWYLAGQLKSPVVNFTQNWILGIPLLEKAMGRPAKGLYHKAMADVARRKYSDIEKKFINEMAARGITGDQLTKEITGQTQAEAGRLYANTISILAKPFSLSEIYNRKVSGLARFRAAIQAGDDYRSAFDKSRKFIFDVHFMYGKLNAPSGARGGTPGAAILRTSLTFRNYTFNFLHAMKGMLSERDFRTVAKAMTYMALLGGASALPFLDGFLDMLERITGISWRKNVKKELENVGGEVLANVGIQGLPALVGVDIGGSLRIHFPDVTDPGKLIEESVFGVYEGLALKAVNSIKAASTGQITRAFEIASPVFLERPLKALRQMDDGLTTTRGKVIKDPKGEAIMPTTAENIATGLGFRPSRLARMSDHYRQFGNIRKFYSDWRSDIYTKFRLADNFEARQKVIQEVMEYNRKAGTEQKGAVILIQAKQLRQALKQRQDKRFAAFSQ